MVMLLSPTSSVGFCHNLAAPTSASACWTRDAAALTSGFIRFSQATSDAGSASSVAIGAAAAVADGDAGEVTGAGGEVGDASAQADRPSKLQNAAIKTGRSTRVRLEVGWRRMNVGHSSGARSTQ